MKKHYDCRLIIDGLSNSPRWVGPYISSDPKQLALDFADHVIKTQWATVRDHNLRVEIREFDDPNSKILVVPVRTRVTVEESGPVSEYTPVQEFDPNDTLSGITVTELVGDDAEAAKYFKQAG